MIIVGILLINTLIAMMGNTYAKVNETKNEWLRQVTEKICKKCLINFKHFFILVGKGVVST